MHQTHNETPNQSSQEESVSRNATLYTNCAVHTMDGVAPAGALLIEGERIVAVGPSYQPEAQASPGARRVDLEGQTVVPGFNDSHAHILWVGLALEQVDVGVDAVNGIEDICRAVQARVRTTPTGDWVLGRGYQQTALREQRHPTRHDLDEISPDHPVMLRHTSGHVLTCNSLALQRAGITRETPSPAGGEIDRDQHGEPTGVLKESTMDLIYDVIPPPSLGQGTEMILRAMDLMARQGITSVSDAATGHGSSAEPELAMYRAALHSEKLAGRITLMPQILYTAPPDSDEIHTPDTFDVGDQPDWLAIGPTKVFSDGALSTRTAALRQPYRADGDNTGILLWKTSTLAGMIQRAHAAGWQIAAHALGDRAVEVMIEVYEEALAISPRRDHRHRIEHCMLLDQDLARRIKAAGLVPSLQPDIYRLGDSYIDALGLERAAQSIPTRLFKELDIPVAFSSDRPVIPGHPLEVIRSAMDRTTPTGVVLGPEHKVTALEAIRNYTWGGAWATHTEHHKGVLRAGLLADFAVLSADPATVPVEEFGELRVTMTVVGGREVYAE